MALRDAILAALLDGEASGYDLAKAFDTSVANFWMATPQQLYRELERMQAAGLIEARLIEQDRRPNKHLFSLTDAGREQLRRFTATPTKPGAIREDLMVAIQALDAGDAAAVRDAVGLLEAACPPNERAALPADFVTAIERWPTRLQGVPVPSEVMVRRALEKLAPLLAPLEEAS